MGPAIHVNRSEAVGATRFENVETLVLPIIQQLRAIGRRDLPHGARRFASDIRFVPDLDAVGKQRPGPGLKRNLTEFRLRRQERIGRFPHIGREEPEVRCVVRPCQGNVRGPDLP